MSDYGDSPTRVFSPTMNDVYQDPHGHPKWQGIDTLKGQGYKRNGSTRGYTGHYTAEPEEEHVLDSPSKLLMIRGYTGHRPHLKNLCGEPMIPSEEKQQRQLEEELNKAQNGDLKVAEAPGYTQGESFNFRAFAKHMDVLERYATAVQHLLDKGQSQEMLLRIVQAKMSERVNSSSVQLIRTRKMFEAFDINKDGVLDEGEFRICLEKMNIQFDDIQNLALFAYFDGNNDGYVLASFFLFLCCSL